MKTRATLFLLVLGAVGGAFWFSGSLSAVQKAGASRNVVIDDEGIVIPGTELSKADHAAMNQILNRYDKSLYRIDTYEKGKLKKTQGKLTDVVTDKQLASQMAANVTRPGFTHYAVQIRMASTINPTDTTPVPGASTNPTGTSPVPGYTTNPTGTSPVPGASTNPTGTPPKPGTTTNPASSANAARPGATTNPASSANAARPGATTNPASSANAAKPGATTNPASSANAAKPKSKEVVDRLKPILEKYRSK